MNKNKKFVIAINREVGSGGHEIGEKIAGLLGVKFYDKAIVKELTKKFNLSVDELEEVRSSKFNWWNSFIESYLNRYRIEERFDIETPWPDRQRVPRGKRIPAQTGRRRIMRHCRTLRILHLPQPSQRPQDFHHLQQAEAH